MSRPALRVHADAPLAQPERHERKLADPGLTDLSVRDWVAIFVRAGKESLDDELPMVASALAYSSFFAIPSILLVVLGLFTLVSGPDTIRELMDRIGTFMPSEATELLGDSLLRLEQQPSAGLLLLVVGFVLAMWTSTGAMTTYMSALSTAYDRKDGRTFVRKRLVALAMVAAIGAAVLLVGLLMIFGPYVERWLGQALGQEDLVTWLWWTIEWPLLAVGLLAAFAVLYYFGPDVEHRRWRLVTPGAAVALVVWLLASGGFAVYAGLFGSYNKTWGSLSAVIVTLTWLWLTSFALLFGGEINSEVERSRELRQGKPAEPEPPGAASRWTD
jgi:membrane protein